MAEHADVGFMIWDDRSSGTLNNVLNLLGLGKQSVVYAQTTDEFLWTTGTEDLRTLADRIPGEERAAVEEMTGLSQRIQDLSSGASYEIEPVSDTVRESQLELFGAVDRPRGDQRQLHEAIPTTDSLRPSYRRLRTSTCGVQPQGTMRSQRGTVLGRIAGPCLRSAGSLGSLFPCSSTAVYRRGTRTGRRMGGRASGRVTGCLKMCSGWRTATQDQALGMKGGAVMIHDVVKADHVERYRIKITFDHGREGTVDFSSYVEAGGVFGRFQDLEFFKRFTVDRELGVLSRGGEIDNAPETLYAKATGEPLPYWRVAERPGGEVE